eukprot:3478526-Pleurochrysis_carterae.AAC.4
MQTAACAVVFHRAPQRSHCAPARARAQRQAATAWSWLGGCRVGATHVGRGIMHGIMIAESKLSIVVPTTAVPQTYSLTSFY